MAVTSYHNFDLTIMPGAEGMYRAEASTPKGGQPSAVLALSFAEEELTWFREALGGPARDARRSPRTVARAAAEVKAKVRNLGGRLYEEVLTGEVLAGFTNSLLSAREQGAGLRIRLRLEHAPELAQLPWEFLYRRSVQQHLALSEQTPIVRFVQLPDPAVALTVEPPLNILVMIANPGGNYAELAVDTEWSRIEDALQTLEEKGQVSVDRLPAGTWEACQERLAAKRYHVFHFIGHGDFEPATDAATVILERDSGGAEPVSGADLRVLLDHSDLRLVILNSCEGARSSPVDPFAGVAQSLVQAGIPAVIAMQSKIMDVSAIRFARQFYGSLANGLLVDNCLAEARKAMWKHNPTDWGTPVLFMRSPEGRLFQVVGEEQRRQARIRELAEEVQVFVQQERWGKAIDKLEEILAVEAGEVQV